MIYIVEYGETKYNRPKVGYFNNKTSAIKFIRSKIEEDDDYSFESSLKLMGFKKSMPEPLQIEHGFESEIERQLLVIESINLNAEIFDIKREIDKLDEKIRDDYKEERLAYDWKIKAKEERLDSIRKELHERDR